MRKRRGSTYTETTGDGSPVYVLLAWDWRARAHATNADIEQLCLNIGLDPWHYDFTLHADTSYHYIYPRISTIGLTYSPLKVAKLYLWASYSGGFFPYPISPTWTKKKVDTRTGTALNTTPWTTAESFTRGEAIWFDIPQNDLGLISYVPGESGGITGIWGWVLGTPINPTGGERQGRINGIPITIF